MEENLYNEIVENIRNNISKLEELEMNVDDYFKNYFDENDYEYVKAIINGDEPKSIPNDIEKIKTMKHYICQEYIYNVLKKHYIERFGNISGFIEEEKETKDSSKTL